jgi:anti-anti-sigma regulatory factor
MNQETVAAELGSPIALNLFGSLDFQGGHIVVHTVRRIALTEGRNVIVCTEKLRLTNFFGFRELAEGIVSLRSEGFSILMSVTDPRLRAIVDDLGLGDVCVNGLVLNASEPRRLYVGTRYSATGLTAAAS